MNKPTFKDLYYLCVQKLTNFPYIEENFDALTNYELLCKVVEELNKMITNMNTQNESIIALYNAFNELKTYIDTYFENLDVQEEINNKLDEMAQDGTLQEIVASYLEIKAIFGFDTVEDMKQATNLINGSYACTLGFHKINDSGGATYKVRNITNDDIVDNMFIIPLLNNNLIAELIVNNELNIKKIGAYGDYTHDDSSYFQKGLDYCSDKKIPLFIPIGYNYLIRNSLILNKNNKYYIRSIPSKEDTIIVDLQNNDSLFVGSEYINTDYCDIELTMYGLNFRVYNSNIDSSQGATVTVFRAINIIRGSFIEKCNFSNFAIIMEGTLRVDSYIKDCRFTGLKEYFMTNTFKVGGILDDSHVQGIINDSKILKCYISGNLYYLPVMIRAKNIDYDTLFEQNFIENFRYLFQSHDNIIQGCDFKNNIVEQSCALFAPNHTVTNFNFISNDFENLREARIREVAPNCPDLETLCSNKIGILIKENTETGNFRNITFIDNRIQLCDYFIYINGNTDSTARQHKDTYITEKNTDIDNSYIGDSPIIFQNVLYDSSTDTYNGTYNKSWFDLLNYKIFDTLPEAYINRNNLAKNLNNNTFKGQHIIVNDKIYISIPSTNFPIYKEI